MAEDQWSGYYQEFLDGSYDCVDRIVLNGYCALCHSPAGFRHWWRRLPDGSDEELDNAHGIRMAGRFSRRVRAYAEAHGIQSSTAAQRTTNIASQNNIWRRIPLFKGCF